jgi:phospholipase C
MHRTVKSPVLFVAAFLSVIAAGCSAFAPLGQQSRASPQEARLSSHVAPDRSPISHIVVIIMENRSFNNLFMNYPGALTATSGETHDGKFVKLQPISLAAPGDVYHSHADWLHAYDGGKMDGFDLEGWDTDMPAFAPYGFVPRAESKPYWEMAHQYVLSDSMFESVTGPSYAAHQYLIAGQSDYAIGLPHDPFVWGCDSQPGTTVSVINANGHEVNGPFPCFDYPTLGDLLDAGGLAWRYYAQETTQTWEAYDAISHIRYGPDWTSNIIAPTSQFTTDVTNGTLAPFTWVVPFPKESDHSGTRSAAGPSFVASVVNAIGESQFWSSTAIFVVWDDWGGWYDPVAPSQLDRMGLGFRVPLLVISPYARGGKLSHVPHEFGSILHYAENTFGLPSLGQSDERADDLKDCFNYHRPPIHFKAFSAPYSPKQLRQIEANDQEPPDY